VSDGRLMPRHARRASFALPGLCCSFFFFATRAMLFRELPFCLAGWQPLQSARRLALRPSCHPGPGGWVGTAPVCKTAPACCRHAPYLPRSGCSWHWVGGCLDPKYFTKFHYTKRRFPVTSKCRHIYGVLNVDEIKN
jgi:hypothetical protein